MELEDFINDFADQLEETDPALLTKNTLFRELDEWDSFMGMTIIAMVDEKYKVKLTGEDFRKCATIGELCTVVETKL